MSLALDILEEAGKKIAEADKVEGEERKELMNEFWDLCAFAIEADDVFASVSDQESARAANTIRSWKL